MRGSDKTKILIVLLLSILFITFLNNLQQLKKNNDGQLLKLVRV